MATERHCERQERIEAYVMERIRDGRLKPGDKVPSDHELAKRFGVSAVTATKALAALAGRGAVERRRGAAGTVATSRLGRQGTIGFVMLHPKISHFWRIFDSASDVLTTRGYAVHYLNSDLSMPDGNFWQGIARSGMAGIISVQIAPPLPLPMPVILVDSAFLEPMPYPIVSSDDLGGGFQAGRHLMEMGHREVVFFSGDSVTMTRRAEGFVSALKEYGIKNPHKRIYRASAERLDVPALVHRALKEHPKLTAIATGADPMTADAHRVLYAEKKRIPLDISTVGFGRLEELYTLQRYTTIDQHPSQMGLQAATLLCDWIAHPHAKPESVVIPCNLVPGDTVALLRKG